MLELQRKALQPHLDLLILVLLAVSCYVFFFHGLGNIGFLGPDEPRYASIAADMYRSDEVTISVVGFWVDLTGMIPDARTRASS